MQEKHCTLFDSHLCQLGPAKALPFVTDVGRVTENGAVSPGAT